MHPASGGSDAGLSAAREVFTVIKKQEKSNIQVSKKTVEITERRSLIMLDFIIFIKISFLMSLYNSFIN
jgi:hypothetical protein